MIDLVRIPFIRENAIFKNFLEMDSHYVDDEFFGGTGMDPRRGMQSMGPGSTNFNMHSASFNSRSSVLSPFTSLNNNNSNTSSMIMVNATKTMDGRKSVSPMLNNHTSILHTS